MPISMRPYCLGLSTLSSIDLQLDLVPALVAAHNLGAGLEVDALLLQDLLGALGDLGVHSGAADLVQELNNGDLAAETGPD